MLLASYALKGIGVLLVLGAAVASELQLLAKVALLVLAIGIGYAATRLAGARNGAQRGI